MRKLVLLYSHFTNKETGLGRLGNLSKILKPVKWKRQNSNCGSKAHALSNPAIILTEGAWSGHLSASSS